MGMYTELKLDIELDKNLDNNLVRWFNDCNMFKEDNCSKYCPKELLDTRMNDLCGGSAYFEEEPYNFFNKIENENYSLKLCINIKNYKSEIQTFLDIIDKYVIKEKSNGHIWYEEYDFEDREILF